MSDQQIRDAVEKWKRISGYEKYEVSNFGGVRKRIVTKQGYSWRYLNPSPTPRYLRVSLYNKDNKMRNFLVQVLVAEAFLGKKSIGMEVNHKDCNKHNNCLDNLEIVLHRENVKHAIEHGIQHQKREKNGKFAKIGGGNG